MDDLLVDLDLPKRDSSEMLDLVNSCSLEKQIIFKELITFMKPVLRKALCSHIPAHRLHSLFQKSENHYQNLGKGPELHHFSAFS